MPVANKSLRPDQRLLSAAPFVRGGVAADVGTDHAYLPVWLLLNGKIDFAVASDINPGPLSRAEQTVKEHNLSDRVVLVLTDGLQGLDKYHPCDILIFGMGGELISSIIDAAPWVRNPKIRLILQPMTKRAELRGYLLENGFCIIDEAMSEADGRIYHTICAEFDGTCRKGDYSLAEIMLGRHNIERGGELLMRYAAWLYDIFAARISGKVSAGEDVSFERAVTEAIRPYAE